MKGIQNYLYATYCVGLVTMNILASKQVDILLFTINLGLFISPVVFIINDIQSEVFGYRSAKAMITAGVVANVAVVYFLAITAPPSVNFANQEAFRAVLGSTARITAASVTAYYIGSLINAKVMVSMKRRLEKYLFVRAITSTVAGQVIDNIVFMTLAFAGVLPAGAIITMVIGGTVIETVCEVIFYPITRAFIRKAKTGNAETANSGIANPEIAK
jgi:uncharacterized integral membrane protein (TIGR00697 family)